MLDLFFAQLIKRYGHFSGLGVEIALSHCHVEKTLIFSGETSTVIHGLNEDVTATAYPTNTSRCTNDVLMLAGSLQSRGIIRQALHQRLVFSGIRQPRIFQNIGSVSLFIQHIGSMSAILVA